MSVPSPGMSVKAGQKRSLPAGPSTAPGPPRSIVADGAPAGSLGPVPPRPAPAGPLDTMPPTHPLAPRVVRPLSVVPAIGAVPKCTTLFCQRNRPGYALATRRAATGGKRAITRLEHKALRVVESRVSVRSDRRRLDELRARRSPPPPGRAVLGQELRPASASPQASAQAHRTATAGNQQQPSAAQLEYLGLQHVLSQRGLAPKVYGYLRVDKNEGDKTFSTFWLVMDLVRAGAALSLDLEQAKKLRVRPPIKAFQSFLQEVLSFSVNVPLLMADLKPANITTTAEPRGFLVLDVDPHYYLWLTESAQYRATILLSNLLSFVANSYNRTNEALLSTIWRFMQPPLVASTGQEDFERCVEW
eukprot:g20548.t1